MKKIEIILVGIFVFSILLFLNNIPFGSFVFAISMSALLFVYFYLSFAIFNDIKIRDIFKRKSYENLKALRIIIAILIGFAFSEIIVGVWFKLYLLPQYFTFLNIGLIIVFLLAIFCLFKYIKEKNSFFKKALIRIIVIGGIGFCIHIFPINNLIDIKYKKHPEYAELLKQSLREPENFELKDKIREEEIKIYSDKQ
mgnify:CR=1 FL=1